MCYCVCMTDRQNLSKLGNIPKTEGGQIHLHFKIVLWSPWNSTDIERGFVGANVYIYIYVFTYPCLPSATVLGHVAVLRLYLYHNFRKQADRCYQMVAMYMFYWLPYVKEKSAIFPAFSSMLPLGISFQQIIKNNLMKAVWTYFPSNDFFLAYDCVFLVVTLITSKSRKCNGVIQCCKSIAPLGWSEFINEHVNGTSVGVDTT